MTGFNLADMFERVVDSVPNRTALVAGNTRLSYLQLEQRANRLANYLAGKGIGPEDKVGILSFNRAEWVESMWACLKIRAVPININYRYVEEELAYIIDNADLVGLVHEQSFGAMLSNIAGDLPKLQHYIAIDDSSQQDCSSLHAKAYEQALSISSDQRNFGPRSSDDLYMLYTGGTTGMPKGTMWRHEDIFFAALQGGNPGGAPIERPEQISELIANSEHPFAALCPAPMMHGGGEWYCMIYQLSGNTFVLYTEHSFNADTLLQLAAKEQVINLIVVGDAMARPVAEALASGKHTLPSLLVIGSGGAILSKPVKQQLQSLLPNALIIDSFGASETGAGGAVMDQGEPNAAGPRFTLTPNTAILDEQLSPVQPGDNKAGRLARCGHIPLGYYKDEKKTQETFQHDANGKRWVIPGDYARVLSDGTAELLGRGSACINSGGEKIYAEEVEAILKGHPAIFDIGVIGIPDSRFGSKVAAIIELRNNHSITLEEIRDYCDKKMASYKVPREIVTVDSIPRTPAAKPDYRKMKALIFERLSISD